MLDVERAASCVAAFRESLMKVGYVVLYVNDAEACRRFWVEQIGMVEKRRTETGSSRSRRSGSPTSRSRSSSCRCELMKDNPDGLDLATPSIGFNVDDLEATHAALVELGVRRPMSATTRARRASPSRIPRAAGSR